MSKAKKSKKFSEEIYKSRGLSQSPDHLIRESEAARREPEPIGRLRVALEQPFARKRARFGFAA